MFKKQRFAFLAIGGLGLLAAIAPGLAATLGTPQAGSVPAAGQGTATVQGFVVTDIDWTIDAETQDANVVQVRFTIERSGDGENPTVGAAPVQAKDGGIPPRNAQVRVRLLSDTADAAWVDCEVEAGEAVCNTGGDDDTMPAADLKSVDIIAFDTTEPPS